MKISLIKSHPKNAEIYDPTDNSTLLKSIKENGLLEPIVVTKIGTILSGHRRFEVVNSLGWTDVDVRVVDPENELVVLIECNRYRTKSEKDILRESRILETELRKQIGRGRNAAKNRSGKSLTMDLELSKRLGVGTTKLKQLKSIERYDPKLLILIEKKKISVPAAYKKVREKFGSTTKKKKKNSFEISFRKLLSEHSPSYDIVTKTISKTYPYSLEKTGLSDFERDELKDQLLELSSMSSEQLMLLQKQDELEHSNCSRSQISVAKKLLPNAKELNSALLNEIEIISTIDGDPNFSVGLWKTLRQRISSLEYYRGLGRGMKFFIGFRNKRKRFRLLGIVEFASDSQRLKVRDNLIGWNDDQRSKNREHLVNVSTCVATQPFGHDYLGMKFLVSLFPRLVKKWETKYQTKIVAVLTTSIHGNKSVYRGIPHLKNIGKSSGQQLLKPLRLEWEFWNTWLNEHFAEDLEILKSRSSPLQTRLKFLYQVLGFDQKEFYHSHQRGVFLMSLYSNWTEFLRGEIKENKLSPISEEDWINWWMNKSTDRTEKLKKMKGLLNEKYFLDGYDQKMIQRLMTQITI